MSTQRYISTSFWTDKWVRRLDPSERYLYLYLLTNPQTNIAGIYQITIDRIAFDTGYDERTLYPMLDRFATDGKAYLIDDEWVIIPSWPKHQRIRKRDNNRKGIDAILKELPDHIFEELERCGYTYAYLHEIERDTKTLARPLQDPSKPLARESNYSDSDSDSDSDTDPDTKEEAPSADAGASSEVATVETVPQEVEGEDGELYAWLKQRFEKEQPGHRFTNYGKEGKAIKGIIAKAKAREPTDPGAFAEGMVETFAELRRRDKKFFGKQPFLPSSLNASGIWDRVLSEAYEAWQQEQAVGDDWEAPPF